MNQLFPYNQYPSRFGNKYKNLLSCIATGIKTYANNLSEFNELLDSEAIAPPGIQGYHVDTWRLLILHQEESLLDSSFQDSYSIRYQTTSPEFSTIYSNHSVIDLFYHKIPKDIQKRLLIAQTLIPWSPMMKQILSSVPLSHRVIGVSVRTWKAPQDKCELAERRAKAFNAQKYIDIIARYENKVEGIFFSFDSVEAEELFKEVKIPRINFCLPPSLTPIQHAAVKAKFLGNCGLLIGDKDSTYIETAWWMGGCNADIILV